MAYTFSVVAWQDWQQNRFGGTPPAPQDARGVKVVATGDDGDTHQFWAYTITQFQDFAEWWVLIGGLMEMHGMPLEDEPPGDEPVDEPEDDFDYGPPERKTIIERIRNLGSRIARWFR